MHNFGNLVRLLMYNTNRNVCTRKQDLRDRYKLNNKDVTDLIDYTKNNIKVYGLELVGIDKADVVDPLICDKYFLRKLVHDTEAQHMDDVKRRRISVTDIDLKGDVIDDALVDIQNEHVNDIPRKECAEVHKLYDNSHERGYIQNTIIQNSNTNNIISEKDKKIYIIYSLICIENNTITLSKLVYLCKRLKIFENDDIENYIRFIKKDNYINIVKQDDEYMVVLGFRYYTDMGVHNIVQEYCTHEMI